MPNRSEKMVDGLQKAILHTENAVRESRGEAVAILWVASRFDLSFSFALIIYHWRHLWAVLGFLERCQSSLWPRRWSAGLKAFEFSGELELCPLRLHVSEWDFLAILWKKHKIHFRKCRESTKLGKICKQTLIDAKIFQKMQKAKIFCEIAMV